MAMLKAFAVFTTVVLLSLIAILSTVGIEV